MSRKMPGHVGAEIGRENLARVRAFFAAHLGCTNVECARSLGISVVAVGRHVATLRREWAKEGDLDG